MRALHGQRMAAGVFCLVIPNLVLLSAAGRSVVDCMNYQVSRCSDVAARSIFIYHLPLDKKNIHTHMSSFLTGNDGHLFLNRQTYTIYLFIQDDLYSAVTTRRPKSKAL